MTRQKNNKSNNKKKKNVTARKRKSKCCRKQKKGGSLLNNVIDRIPFEMHMPGYQYCGPGTKLEKRLQRGDTGINKLDEACKEHDIAYTSKNNEIKHEADKKLISQAWKSVKARDATFGEKSSALT